uniref:Uncharacterized protein n=1 Tax=Anguilla anguilla TaxID=7936 RepID=A0A0E9REK8_ANGAN
MLTRQESFSIEVNSKGGWTGNAGKNGGLKTGWKTNNTSLYINLHSSILTG